MTLRDKLLCNKPKVREIAINGETYYIRDLNVGEVNQQILGQRQKLIKLAEQQGFELDYEDEDALQATLRNVYDPYSLPRALATRLCDKDGNNLFDPQNEDDLKALSQLDSDVFNALNAANAAGDPKNSQSDENSN